MPIDFEALVRDGRVVLEFEDSAGQPCRAYVGTAGPNLRIGRDRRYTEGPLDLDADGARAVAALLLRWAETGTLDAKGGERG